MIIKTKAFFILYFLLLPIFLLAQENATLPKSELSKLTDNEKFNVTVTSKLDPIAINTMHAWIIHVENIYKQDVLEADIKVDGGMPEHNHGLPTRPQVTKNLGDGCYLLEGMKFHMGGRWTISISISDGNVSDNVTFDLNL